MPDTDAAISALLNYRDEIDGIFGLHADACFGFHSFRERLENALTSLPNASPEKRIFFGNIDPSLPSSQFQHVATIQQVIDRNTKDGVNERRLRQSCIVLAYMHWDDHARPNFASALAVKTNEIKSPLFADLGKLRHAVAHNKGVLSKRTEVLTMFTEGTEISLSHKDFDDLMRAMVAELERLALLHTGQKVEIPFDHELRHQAAL
jgi:hypothetical protein